MYHPRLLPPCSCLQLTHMKLVTDKKIQETCLLACYSEEERRSMCGLVSSALLSASGKKPIATIFGEYLSRQRVKTVLTKLLTTEQTETRAAKEFFRILNEGGAEILKACLSVVEAADRTSRRHYELEKLCKTAAPFN
mmetsp:Transcript_43480/g.85795  ORF Transcript_43480/g.85795 Transcript_43480/m.85795 type:complete len:138 (+) Transcript_43480:298-711(+)